MSRCDDYYFTLGSSPGVREKVENYNKNHSDDPLNEDWILEMRLPNFLTNDRSTFTLSFSILCLVVIVPISIFFMSNVYRFIYKQRRYKQIYIVAFYIIAFALILINIVYHCICIASNLQGQKGLDILGRNLDNQEFRD